jgi:transaldolase/glucose-6-phosphate isomerase
MTGTHPAKALQDHGQSFWLDFLSRSSIRTGGLQKLVEDGVQGVRSSASTFEKASFRSRREYAFAQKVLSAMRKGFGGHVEPEAGHR